MISSIAFNILIPDWLSPYVFADNGESRGKDDNNLSREQEERNEKKAEKENLEKQLDEKLQERKILNDEHSKAGDNDSPDEEHLGYKLEEMDESISRLEKMIEIISKYLGDD